MVATVDSTASKDVEQVLEPSVMHQARSSVIAIVVSVLAHVSLIILSSSAKAGNYIIIQLQMFHLSTGLQRPLYRKGLRPG